MKTEMEALIYHFKIFTEGFAPPPGEVYQRIESPRGELGFFVASDGSPKPYRVKMRAPSFVNLQALAARWSKGRLVADVIACIGTTGYRAREKWTADGTAAGTGKEIPDACWSAIRSSARRWCPWRCTRRTSSATSATN